MASKYQTHCFILRRAFEKNSVKKTRVSNCLQNALTSRMLKVISKLLEKD